MIRYILVLTVNETDESGPKWSRWAFRRGIWSKRIVCSKISRERGSVGEED